MRLTTPALAIACLLSVVFATVAEANDQIIFKQLTKRVWVALDQPDGSPLTNAMVIVTDAGVVVVDSLGAPKVGEWLIEKIATITKQPVRYLVNTHAHMGHIGGNKAFGDSVTVIAHPVTRRKMVPAKGQLGHLPNLTVEKKLDLHLGGVKIKIWHPGPAHTYGDLLVYVPSEKVIMVGDLYKTGVMANHSEGLVQGVIDEMGRIAELEIDHVVAGHGHVAKLRDLLDYRSMLLLFMNDMRRLFALQGKPGFTEKLKGYELPEQYRARYRDRNGSIHATMGQAMVEIEIEHKKK